MPGYSIYFNRSNRSGGPFKVQFNSQHAKILVDAFIIEEVRELRMLTSQQINSSLAGVIKGTEPFHLNSLADLITGKKTFTIICFPNDKAMDRNDHGCEYVWKPTPKDFTIETVVNGEICLLSGTQIFAGHDFLDIPARLTRQKRVKLGEITNMQPARVELQVNNDFSKAQTPTDHVAPLDIVSCATESQFCSFLSD